MRIFQLPHNDVDPALMLRARHFLSGHLSNLYPGFDKWFNTKVIDAPDAIVLVATEGERLAGVSIGKRGVEAKLRCVRVGEAFQGTGLGLRFVDKMLDCLGTDKPHCTVAEEMMHDYSRAFVKRYGFSLSDVTKGEYRPTKLEYHWN